MRGTVRATSVAAASDDRDRLSLHGEVDRMDGTHMKH
jgi:hypothetical protein